MPPCSRTGTNTGSWFPQGQEFLEIGGVGGDVDEFRRKAAPGLQGLVVAAVDADVRTVYFHEACLLSVCPQYTPVSPNRQGTVQIVFFI